MLAFVALATAQSNEQYLVNTKTLNMRNGAGKEYEVMTIDHIEMLEQYLKIIIKAYDEYFFMNPSHLKVYSVNQKLREVETPNLKDFTIDVLKGLTINTEKKKLTRKQRVKEEADLYVKKWALGQVKLGKKSA
jgi:hypothetical protein